MKRRLHEVSLTGAEVERILAICGPNALLVGGQALAFWAARFDVEPIAALSGMVTTEVVTPRPNVLAFPPEIATETSRFILSASTFRVSADTSAPSLISAVTVLS